MAKCKSRQYSDQMVCHDCRLVWDMNDPDPPPCKLEVKPDDGVVDATIANLKSFLATTMEKIKL